MTLKAILLATAFAVASHAQTPVTFGDAFTLKNRTYQPFFCMQLADVNGDGNLDIIADNSNYIEVFLGDGTGEIRTSYALGSVNEYRTADQFQITDFNGDGIPDLVTTAYRTNKIQILLGQTNGLYNLSQTITLPIQESREEPTRLTVADVTGDGKLDVIASYPGSSTDTQPNDYGIVIVPGVGDGTFGKPYEIALGAYSTAAADINGDGVIDIVGSPKIELFGKGGGGFSYNTQSFGSRSAFIFVADVNHDGNPDVITLGNDGHALAVNLGNGDGTFQATALTPLQGVGIAGLLQDFNSDGTLDVALLMADNTVEMALGNGDGTFKIELIKSLTSPALVFASGDLNGDGKPDLVYASAQDDDPQSYTIIAVLNTTP